jgi:hypothetical protein
MASDILDLTPEEEASRKNFNKKMFHNVLRRQLTARMGEKRASLRDEMATAVDQGRETLPERSEIVYIATYDLKISNKEELTECLCRVKGGHEDRSATKALAGGRRSTVLEAHGRDQEGHAGGLCVVVPLPRRLAHALQRPTGLQKIFFDAGLEQLAAKMGYPSASVKTALKESRNFRKKSFVPHPVLGGNVQKDGLAVPGKQGVCLARWWCTVQRGARGRSS